MLLSERMETRIVIRARLAVIVAKHNYRLQHESANVFASAKMQEYNIVPTAGWHRSLWSTLTTLNKRGVTDLNRQHIFCCPVSDFPLLLRIIWGVGETNPL